MGVFMRMRVSVVGLGLLSTPALAHPGDHSGLTFGTIAGHLMQIDHLLAIVLIVLVGVLAFSSGRRAERARNNGGRRDPR
jgi:hydrogenase/urease accessory protein HupE